MIIAEYQYRVEECDVPAVRRPALTAYRDFLRICLELMRGDADTSVINQVHNLTWHTAVFRTLNEARRVEPDRTVNGAMWELITSGYLNLMTLGIRRLVDRNPRTNSVWSVIAKVEKRPELLVRENFICYDGLPYDYQAVQQKFIASLGSGPYVGWMPTKGPDAWGTSQIMHKAFDDLCGNPTERKRSDAVQLSVLAGLKAQLSCPAIASVCTMADKRIAHAERLAEGSDAVPLVTLLGIDEALRHIVRIANYLSSSFFYDTTFGSVVAIPQFDVLEGLDQPWAKTESIPALHQHWRSLCATMDKWTEQQSRDFPGESEGAG